MTELLSYEVVMNLVDEYEGNEFKFEYYPIDDMDEWNSKWREMSYYRYANSNRWICEEKTEWEEFVEEL